MNWNLVWTLSPVWGPILILGIALIMKGEW